MGERVAEHAGAGPVDRAGRDPRVERVAEDDLADGADLGDEERLGARETVRVGGQGELASVLEHDARVGRGLGRRDGDGEDLLFLLLFLVGRERLADVVGGDPGEHLHGGEVRGRLTGEREVRAVAERLEQQRRLAEAEDEVGVRIARFLGHRGELLHVRGHAIEAVAVVHRGQP